MEKHNENYRESMYKSILIPLDNSDYSNSAAELGLKLAEGLASTVTFSHVYAARLHNDRFRQMESGLPPEYQEESELKRQRSIHNDLISKGLKVISDSYIDTFEKKGVEAGIPCKRSILEGKNYLEIVKEVQNNDYDLVMMGALGLGFVGSSTIGSVCERVMRRINRDMMVVRDGRIEGRYLVAVDGSPNSYAGLLSAIAISRLTGAQIEAVAAFDPHYHSVAFNKIAGVLSEEAGKIFKFKEQEKLHEDIIDKGLARIYQDHLNRADEMAGGEGVTIKTTLLTGKPYDRIIKYAEKEKPALLVMGRVGVHAAAGLDIGSNTENCARSASCNMLIVSREVTPPALKEESRNSIPWTAEAEDLINRIPPMARGMVRNIIEEFAVKRGYNEVTAEYVRKARERMSAS